MILDCLNDGLVAFSVYDIIYMRYDGGILTVVLKGEEGITFDSKVDKETAVRLMGLAKVD